MLSSTLSNNSIQLSVKLTLIVLHKNIFKQAAQEDNDRSPEAKNSRNQGHVTPK